MTRKERKSNESRLSNNIKRTATTVIITAAVVGSIGITNSVRAEEKDVNITSSNSVDTTTMSGGSTSMGESSSVSTSPISTNSITVSSIPKNKEESPKPEAISSNTGYDENAGVIESKKSANISISGLSFDEKNPLNNGGIILKDEGPVKNLESMNNDNVGESGASNKVDKNIEKNKLIDDALEQLEKLSHLSEEQKNTVKANFENDRVGNSDLKTVENNLKSLLDKARKLNDDAKKEAEKKNIESKNNENSGKDDNKTEENPNKEESPDKSLPKVNEELKRKREEIRNRIIKVREEREKVAEILKDKIEGLDERTKNNIEMLMNDDNIKKLPDDKYGDIIRDLLDGLTDDGGNFTWDGIKKSPQNPMVEPEKPISPEVPKKDKEDKPSMKPKAEPKSPKEKKPEVGKKDDKKPEPKKPEVEKKIEKKPEAKMPEANKPKVEKKPEVKMPKDNKPKVMAPKDNKDSLKTRVIDPKSDSKEKTENKKPESNSPEMKKPEMKSPQKDDMNKKGDTNKKKMNEAPKKENNKNRMSDKMNEAPKNIKKKMLPQMGIQHSIATSLMGLSSLVGAALILFKKNDK
ncbi:hypothetical protein [Peptostreptococcus porci]|uniref:hypothetical protein n=1 Tax=Peptostreptococcus porci TaxID=2652282 RepID=UPI002A91302F|nr:hypothetical protein [Peptostreptococcus porci]MDY6232958.1 hypothetical protein [Peptostreptococcus porci]